jgi:O-antigen ligase
VLNTAACLALFFHFLRRSKQRDLWHSPVTLTALAALLLAAAVPLSASRSCTVLLVVLLGGALVHLLRRVMQHRRANHESATAPVLGLILAAALAVTAISYLGADVMAQRMQQTAEQLMHIEQSNTLNTRLTLYRDTWHMAAERPWFGWGLESYAHVFRIFNTQRAGEAWIWITFYAEAHNDWLQSLAEVGFVGTTLLGLLLALPLWRVRWREVQSLVPRYLLAGNIIILLYAWLEFPFANPAVVLTFFAIFYIALRYAQQETLHRAVSSQ